MDNHNPTTIPEIQKYFMDLLIPCLKELEMGKELEAEVFINSIVKSVRRITCNEIEEQVLLKALEKDSIPVDYVLTIIKNV